MSIETNRLIIVLLSFSVISFVPVFCFADEAPIQDVRISGSVMDYQANPVDGVDVYLFELHWAYAEGRKLWKPLGKTVTDTGGKFSREVQVVNSGNIWIVTFKPGLALGYETVTHESTDIKFTVKLAKTDILAGKVLDENKQPISNARLLLCLSSESAGGRDISIPELEQLFLTTSDTQGRFSFSHVPEGASADFFVEAPGKVASWTFWENDNIAGSRFPVGRKDIEIVLNKESCIEGQVIDVDTGEGVSGVTLLARADKGLANYYSSYRVVSGQKGRFQISGLPADDYSLQVMAPYEGMPEWVGKDVKVAVSPGQTEENVKIPVSKGAIIEISVKDPNTDEPLEGAWINVRQTANFGRHTCYYKSVYSDKNGLATFRVPQSECQLAGGGYLYVHFQDPEPINAVKGQIHRRDLGLFTKPSVSGIVTDQQGKPVANVSVASKPVCEQSVRTDVQGRFLVRWYLHPRYTSKKWFLLAQDMDNHRASLVEITEQTRAKNLTLEPAYTFYGQITDPNGRAISMALIRLSGSMPGWSTSVGNKVYTDKQGRYEFKAVPAEKNDFRYRLEIDADGYGSIGNIDIHTEGDPNTPVQIRPVILQPADQSISGIVVDANEQPVSGLEIFISGPRGSRTAGQPSRETITDEQGKFFVDGVCKGPLRIQAGLGGRSVEPGFMDAQGGDKDIKVILGQRLVHTPQQSLLGKTLPDISEVGIKLEDSEDKVILVCFFDYQQRPSRNCILQLSKRTQELKSQGIEIFAVHASKIEQEKLDEWIKENEITFPIGLIKADEEQTRFNWGVKSLPWLILTDAEHIVRAEGFALSELDEKIITIENARQ